MLTPNVHENEIQYSCTVAVVMLIATIVNKGLLFCRTKENVNTDWDKYDYQWEAIQWVYLCVFLRQVNRI